jgi:hypothetical protein
MQPTAQEIQKTQGTRLSETAPWQSYDDEMGTKMTPQLAAQVAEYAQKHHHDGPVSSQTKELLAEQRELNDELARQYQWVTPEEYANQEERVGRVMHSSELITLLRKSGLNCFYREHPHPDKVTLLVSVNGGPLEVAAWSQYGMMPELSMFNFDDHGVPLAEKRRGWRTVTLQLILKGLLTEEKANKVFGKPGVSAAFSRYNGLLYEWRKRDKGWE